MPGILIVFYAVAQIVASLQGLETYLGVLGALFVLGTCLYFRFTLPLTVAAFLCAKNVWGWHWFFALVFAAPGLAFMLPAIAAMVIAALLAVVPATMAKRKQPQTDDGIIEAEFEEVFDGKNSRPSAPPVQPQITGALHRKKARGLVVSVVGLLAFIGGIVAIVHFAQNSSTDSETASIPYNDSDFGNALVENVVQDEAVFENAAEPTLPDLAYDDMNKAVGEFDRVYSASGMSGVMNYSKKCHTQLSQSRAAKDFDFCTSFDLAAAMIEQAAAANGFPPLYYFREVTSADSIKASARLISADEVATGDRIQRIKAGTTDALSNLANSKTVENDHPSPETAYSSESENAL